MAISREQFLALYPRLYHTAQAGSWPSIKRRGLLSTSALLDLFEVNGTVREAIESQHRPNSVEITHAIHGRAIIRDQKPMSEKALLKCLVGTTPRQWYELLNRRVFFWVTQNRVLTLLGARAYKNQEHDVLTIDTRALFERYAARLTLSPINSGSTVYNPQPRGLDLFKPLTIFPFENRQKYGERAVAELSVNHSVPDLEDFVIRVERRRGTEIRRVLYQAR
jgi:hypothetical protein